MTETPGSPSVWLTFFILWQNPIQTGSYLDRQCPREPLVVATQPELPNQPAHLLKFMKDDHASSFRSWAFPSATSLVVSVRQCVAGPVTARGVPYNILQVPMAHGRLWANGAQRIFLSALNTPSAPPHAARAVEFGHRAETQ